MNVHIEYKGMFSRGITTPRCKYSRVRLATRGGPCANGRINHSLTYGALHGRQLVVRVDRKKHGDGESRFRQQCHCRRGHGAHEKRQYLVDGIEVSNGSEWFGSDEWVGWISSSRRSSRHNPYPKGHGPQPPTCGEAEGEHEERKQKTHKKGRGGHKKA
jgi:hypothetical protein